MAAVKEREKLGVINGIEYWWNSKTDTVEERVPDIREAIYAPEGYVVLDSDYAQIEVKLMAWLAKEMGLITPLNEGKDIHCSTATKAKGLKLGFDYDLIFQATKAKGCEDHLRHEELDLIRSRIKTTTFGVPYGAGPQTVAIQTGMTVEEAEDLINDFFAGLPALKAWIEEMGKFAMRWGFTATPAGRKRFYVMPNPQDPDFNKIISQIKRWAGNHPIQASCTDMIKKAARAIYLALRGGVWAGPRIWDARFLLLVHDEIVMFCRKDHAEPVSQIMKTCMQEAYDSIILPSSPYYIFNEVKVKAAVAWEK